MNTNLKFTFSIFVVFAYLFIATATDDVESSDDECIKAKKFVSEYRSAGDTYGIEKYDAKLILKKNMEFEIKYFHTVTFPDNPENKLPKNIKGTWEVICDDLREKIEFEEVVETYENRYLLFYYKNEDLSWREQLDHPNGKLEFFKVRYNNFPEELYIPKDESTWDYKVASNGLSNSGSGSYVYGVPDRYWKSHSPGSPLKYFGRTFKKYD